MAKDRNWFGEDLSHAQHVARAQVIVASAAADRSHLLKKVPDSIPDLIAQFSTTATADQDQLVITSIDIELKTAGLEWADLANLLRWQIVAHRRADLSGIIQATRAHPNLVKRLNDWERSFLESIDRKNAQQARLLTDKQMSCLQSIIESLDMSDDDFAMRQVSRGGQNLGG